jgi:O-antigen ligase
MKYADPHPTAISLDRHTNWHKAIPLLLVAVFFIIQYNPYQQITEEVGNPEIYESLQAIKTGSALRQVALFSLGLFGMLGVFGYRRKRLRVEGWLGWAVLLFLFLALLSILWAEDRGLTGRRLVAFAMVCLGALAFAQFYNPEDLVSFALLATGTYLLIGVSAEITSGSFHPLQKDYRFSGLMDPNNQAMNCAVLFFASLVSADSRNGNRYRRLLLVLSATAFLFLFLTKSRTTLAGATLALGAYWMLGASTYRKVAVFLGCVWFACCILLFLPDGAFVSISSKTIFPGRDISDIGTLTGRTDIWKACLSYIAIHPLLGYGFGSFWSTNRTLIVEEVAGWVASSGHSTYIDLVLSLGLVGLVLYVVMIAGGIRRSAILSSFTHRSCYGFLYALLVYCVFLGFLETVFPNPGLLTFLVLSGLTHLTFQPPSADPEKG